MSMKASLQILRDALGRKVAVLGDMGELGIREDALHAEVGTFAASCGLDLLICTGPHCAYMAQAARKAGMEQVIHLDSLEELLNRLPGLVKEGDTILVKASHYMHFEKVVDALQNS